MKKTLKNMHPFVSFRQNINCRYLIVIQNEILYMNDILYFKMKQANKEKNIRVPLDLFNDYFDNDAKKKILAIYDNFDNILYYDD